MAAIKCQIICNSSSRHLSQIHTGLKMLYDDKKIGLYYCCNSRKKLPGAVGSLQSWIKAPYLLLMIVNGRKVVYDMADGDDLDKDLLEKVDCYFKRSCSQKHRVTRNGHTKVLPYGLNYPVAPNAMDRFHFSRSLHLRKGARKFTGMLHALKCHPDFTDQRLKMLEAWPDFNAPPKIIFLTTTYDPERGPSEKNRADRIKVNNTRAQCIRILRKEFGKHFTGGFDRIPGKKWGYDDCLVDDPRITRRDRYIKTLRSFPICLTTTGLHGSIGWKFGEYVSLSKAIISEKIHFVVPGLAAGQNYLAFSTPDQCVDSAWQLFSNRTLRNSIMRNNAEYYAGYLRPDLLMMKTILTALAF